MLGWTSILHTSYTPPVATIFRLQTHQPHINSNGPVVSGGSDITPTHTSLCQNPWAHFFTHLPSDTSSSHNLCATHVMHQSDANLITHIKLPHCNMQMSLALHCRRRKVCCTYNNTFPGSKQTYWIWDANKAYNHGTNTRPRGTPTRNATQHDGTCGFSAGSMSHVGLIVSVKHCQAQHVTQWETSNSVSCQMLQHSML